MIQTVFAGCVTDLERWQKKHSYETNLIYLDVPLDEIHRRMQRNEKSQERYGIKEEIFTELVQNFQHPEADKNILLFQSNYRIQDWLETCIKIN